MSRVIKSRVGAASLAVAAIAVGGTFALPGSAQAATYAPPPVHAGFDYQINGGYTPPSGVTVVSRDWKDTPASGLYNICYVNAFQTQEPGDDGGPQDWDQNLLLKDASGKVIIDKEWNEALLDISTEAKRASIAAVIEGQIDTCASKGFKALELDNYDSYTRSNGKFDETQAQAYIKVLSAYGHGKGLAVAQKNTLELAQYHVENGLDFAIVEECGTQKTDECTAFVNQFGNNVIFIEYTDAGLTSACRFGDRVSVVERDVEVDSPSDDDGKKNKAYVHKTCPGGGGGSGAADTQAPTAPSNLKATGSTGNSVSLSWTASTDDTGVTGYDVYRNGTKVGTTAATTYTDSGLSASTTYTYSVKAHDAAGNVSAASGTVSKATTSGGGSGSTGNQGCTATMSKTGTEDGGFDAAVAVKNTGTATTKGWKLTWTWPGAQKISDPWDIVSTQNGQSVTATNNSEDGAISAGDTWKVEFAVSGSVPSPFPTITCTTS